MGKLWSAVAAIATLLLLTAAIIFFIIYTGKEGICTSKKCVQIANELLTSMDQDVDACDDFFAFACGNVRRLASQGAPERNDGDYTSEEDYLVQAKASSIARMIEEPSNPYETKTLTQIKSFYRSCERANQTIGGITAEGIKAILKDIGGWPMLDKSNWRADRFDWMPAVHRMRQLGIDEDVFIRVDVEINHFDTTKYILKIAMAKDYFGSARINSDADKKLFAEYMVEVAAYFGVDRVRAERDFHEIMSFYDQLKKVEEEWWQSRQRSSGDGEDHNPDHNFQPRSVVQLQHDIAGLSWQTYLNGIVGPRVQLIEDEFVNVPHIEELKRLLDLISVTPKKILANYVCWRVVQKYMDYIPDTGLQERLAKFPSFFRRRNRSEICSKLTRNSFPDLVEACYVRAFVSDDAKRVTKDIIESIKRELVKIVDALDWLDADIKQVSKAKLATVKDYVAYTPEMPASMITSASDVYARLDFDADAFMGNLMKIQSANAERKYQKLRQPVVQDVYGRIEYSVTRNILVLPSDYLQGFYIDDSRPQYMNFGTLGTLIAYQLANVFLEGKRYDMNGELREWSTSQSLFNFDNKTKCLINQNAEFITTGAYQNVNASEDNVARIFGKLIAYKAYLTWIDTHESEQRLPGLPFSTRQLFWIATAMDECYRRTDMLDGAVNAASHIASKLPKSISKLRVVGPLRNAEEFASDFQCAINSYMNPEEKCTFW